MSLLPYKQAVTAAAEAMIDCGNDPSARRAAEDLADKALRAALSVLATASRDDVIRAIAFALGHKVLGLTWKRGHDNDVSRRIAAAAIADYLELAGFKILTGPGIPQGPSQRESDGNRHDRTYS